MSTATPPYDVSAVFTTSQPLEPDWKVGQGQNSHPSTSRNEDDRIPYNVIEIGKTELDTRLLYKVMLGAISPRPVALVGTYNKDGLANLAPVSCSEPYAEALNFASINAPEGVSEFALSGLTPVPGRLVRAPRVGEAPFSMELEVDFTKEWNDDAGKHTTTLVIGRVKMLYIRSDVLDEENSVDPAKMLPVSRFSGKLYSRSTHGYELDVPRWDDYKDAEETKKAIASGPRTVSLDVNTDPVLSHFPTTRK